MLALSLPTNTDVLTRYGTIGTVALVIGGIVLIRAVQSILKRLASLTIVAVLVVVICAHRVKAAATATATAVVENPRCSLFGADVTVPVDKLHPASTK